MKKLSLMMALIMMLGCMVFISGCGSDKFEGKWVGVRETNLLGNRSVIIIELNIKKNGQGYLVSTQTEELSVSPSYGGDKTIHAIHFAKKDDEKNLGATAKDNLLTVSSGRNWTFTYDESDKKLYGVLDYMDNKKVTFTRDEDGSLFDKTKDEEFAEVKDKVQQENPGYTIQETEGHTAQ